MHPSARPPLPVRKDRDRIASRYFVAPLVLWAVVVFAIVLSASLPPTVDAMADAPGGEARTVAYGA